MCTTLFKTFISVMDPRGGGGAGGTVHPPLLKFFVFKRTKFMSKKLVLNKYFNKNLSQNAGYGHFRDSNFQTFLGEHAPRPP